jgi:hypothetical protein
MYCAGLAACSSLRSICVASTAAAFAALRVERRKILTRASASFIRRRSITAWSGRDGYGTTSLCTAGKAVIYGSTNAWTSS